METNTPTKPVSKGMLWTGWTLTGLCGLAMLASGVMKLLMPATPDAKTLEGLAHVGWQLSQIKGLAFLEITCTVLYLIPRTSVLGAILLAGYLGGAIATHVRVGDPPVVQALIGVLVWGGLFLRDSRLRALIPLRRPLSA